MFSPAAALRMALSNSSAAAILQDIAAGSQGNGTGHIGGMIVGGEHQDGQVRFAQLHVAQGGQAVAVRHADVEEHHIQFVFQGVLDGRGGRWPPRRRA